MKKILIVVTLCLALVGATAVPAMAAGPSNTHFPVYKNVLAATPIVDITCNPDPSNPSQQLILNVGVWNDDGNGFVYDYQGDIPSSALKINFSTGTATLNYKITDTTPYNDQTGLGWSTTIPSDTSINLTWSFNPGDADISYGQPYIVSPGSLLINNGGSIQGSSSTPIYFSGSVFGQTFSDIELYGYTYDGYVEGGENINVNYGD